MKYFYSNCFIEAIKAKIKHPFKVKIKYLPAKLNETFVPHVMWHDGEYTYDFYAKGKIPWYKLLYHKGCIRKSEYDYYDRALKTLTKWHEEKQAQKTK